MHDRTPDLVDLLALFGVGSLCRGAWILSSALGWMVLGACSLTIAFLAWRRQT